MLDSVIRLSLRYRFLVVIVSLILLVYGSYLTVTMPIDVFPDLDRPRVVILTECPGLATEEVESLVTYPIEVAMLGTNGVEAVRSSSTAGLNVIYVEFGWDVGIKAARQSVQERLTTLDGVLPSGITPQMTPPSSIMGQIVIAGVYRQRGPNGGILAPIDGTTWVLEKSADEKRFFLWDTKKQYGASPDKQPEVRAKEQREASAQNWELLDEGPFAQPHHYEQDEQGRVTSFSFQREGQVWRVQFHSQLHQQMELGTLGDWVIRPRLLQVDGVAEVFMQGGERKQYQVLVNPAAMNDYGVSLAEIEKVVTESNINTSGGFAITGESEKPIRILGRLGPHAAAVLEDLKRIPVKTTENRTIQLQQVAQIVEGPEFRRGDGAINGRPGLVFTIVKQPHVDTRDLTERIAKALDELEGSLPADTVINTELFQLRNFIDRGVFNVGEALVIGAFLVIIVLFLFLLNFRTTFITLTAIPLSLVVTTLVFRILDWFTDTSLTINVMTLGGIAVAMGELVDDAIVDVENIFRRLRENHLAAEPRPAIRVVYDASREIRSAIVFGTIVVILVFLPLFAISGITGRLFQPLGVAYIVSILSSLLVSLTVTPVFSYYLLPQSKAAHREEDGVLLKTLKWLASGLIRTSMAIPGLLLFLTWVVVAFSALVFANLGTSFLPEFDEGSVQINLTLPPGSSLEASNQITSIVDRRLSELKQSTNNPDGLILNFVRRTGRAERDEHAMPVNASEYIISLNPASDMEREETKQFLKKQLAEEVPGVTIETEQPLAHLMNHMVSGVYAQIAVKLYGDDLDKLKELANEAKQIMNTVEGITEPVIEPIQMTDELHIQFKADELAYYGVSREYLADVLQTALQGEVVSEVLEGQRRFDLLLRLEEAYRTDYANLERLRIDLPDGRGQIQLGDLANIDVGTGPNALLRENARRRIVIRCNTQGRDLGTAVAEIERKLDQSLALPEGYAKAFSGQFESQREATRMILILSAVAVVGMFVVLMVLLPSVRIVLQILNALPTAFIGGVAALALTGQDLTVASLVGFISLGGIAVRNGILLVTHYIHLLQEEDQAFTKETILRGSLERLAPVLMTALTAGIGLVPLVLGGQEPGREILYPVATVILGGLFTSTFCEFLIHPGLFWAFSGKDAVGLAHSDEDDAISQSPESNSPFDEGTLS